MQNRTTIVVAHKLATIRKADNIVVMSQGKIMEQGTHEELARKNGIYASLVKAQDIAPANLEQDHGSEGMNAKTRGTTGPGRS
ncbi:hypothetical protein CNMCM8927_008425 [Aspergillus lentulus]|uniref:Leptomycin B resistance protein pmd1 n=1 Tax=Aspergillus lentulus TaxID=293939 RepID=A0AAN6BKE7_ASPLE|nr:hypothetical protein CNMCM8927_008425 [Aspergillus lentulus]